jgi:hypothetical protein
VVVSSRKHARRDSHRGEFAGLGRFISKKAEFARAIAQPPDHRAKLAKNLFNRR